MSVPKILVPVDGTPESADAVAHALAIVAERGGELHLLHVRLPVESCHAKLLVDGRTLQDWHREEGEQTLAPSLAQCRAAGVEPLCHVIVGHLAETIVRFAHEQHFGLVVMRRHPQAALTHLLLGSVCEDVQARCRIPVTVLD